MKRLLIVSLVTLASLSAAPAMANSIDLTMTNIGLGSSGNGVLGGVYIGPYTVQVTGTTSTFKVICDDFLSDTYIGESWTATISSLSDLAGKFGATSLYNEIGFLAEALFNYSSSTPCQIASCAGANNAADIQYAMWQVFGAPSAFNNLVAGSADALNAAAWLALAQSQTYTAGEFSDLVIYTPTSCITGPGCAPGTATNLPQEFIGRTSVPEPATIGLLLVAMVAAFGYQYHLNRLRAREAGATLPL